MKIEIWSDIVCPFCYIGKRHFEKALEQYSEKEPIEIEWKSFQLNPSIQTQPSKSIHQYLSEIKGISIDEAKSMNDYVSGMASKVGLHYNLDKAVVANSFNAHRIIQLAKSKGLGSEAEEAFFKTYFTEGGNIDNEETLLEVGKTIGLMEKDVLDVIHSAAFSEVVNHDIEEGASLGIRGVPFFVIDRKYGISGAQPVEVFVDTLSKAAGQKING